jgi:FtsH-binding integral membrane protein
MLKPGILKYILFIIFITLIGSSLRNILDRLKAKQILVNVLLTISSIFLTMTVIGFVDKQNTLGFGPYLFASLIGLILGHLGIGAALLFKVPGEQLSGISYAISFISTLVFSIYVAYDTQMLKEDAAACKSHPDYINSALSLYLDILNLFVSVGDLADS